MDDQLFSWLASSARIAIPLIFAAIGGMMSERSGVINIALEGKMLFGAFIGAALTYELGSPWFGFFGAGLFSMALAGLYAFSAIFLQANQIVAGTAINLLAFGMVPLLCKVFYDNTGATPPLSLDQRFVSAPFWICLVAVALAWGWTKFTTSGLWHRFAGENPHALDSAGLSVQGMRYFGVLAAGFFAGLGGATLSLMLASAYSRQMTAGRGFMALAALILGRWKPVPAALACFVFAGFDAAQIRLQSSPWIAESAMPLHLLQTLPYIATLLVLCGLVGNVRPPSAIGQNFGRGSAR